MPPELMAMKKRLQELEQDEAMIKHLLEWGEVLITASREEFEKVEANAHFDYRFGTKVVHTRQDEIQAFWAIARYELVATVRQIRNQGDKQA